MITFKHSGSFNKTEIFFRKMSRKNYLPILERYGRDGVTALSLATVIDSGLTSQSWKYVIKKTSNGHSISWHNSNVVDGVPIAIIIQYGHTTRNGGYVQGRDYINPALRPIFDKILSDLWKEVKEA